MKNILLLVVILAISLPCGNASADRLASPEFTKMPITITDYHLFDLGVADVNNDNAIDIFTVNHYSTPGIFLNDGSGHFSDNVIADFQLGFEADFPGLAQLQEYPQTDDDGLYIYWRGPKELVIHAKNAGSLGQIKGRLKLDSKVFFSERGFLIQSAETELPKGLTATTIEFQADSSSDNNIVVIVPLFVAIPIKFELDANIPLQHVYVGPKRINPKSHEFSLALGDRHGIAWADFNSDGLLDAYISRGALKGMMEKFPGRFNDKLVCNTGRTFIDCTRIHNIEKNNRRARTVKWVDHNGDGMLDLYIGSLHSRNQLFEQTADGSFRDVAPQLGLDIEDSGSLVWLDSDNDGDMDLLITKSDVTSIYVNHIGSYEEVAVAAGGKGGHFTVSDYDLDGDLDVFRSSPDGNIFLQNNGGIFTARKPHELGLPEASLTAVFVDYDNDSLPDLHLLPGGLYRRQEKSPYFVSTGLLGDLAGDGLQDARVEWFDADNNGFRDVVFSVLDEKFLGSLSDKIKTYIYRFSLPFNIERPSETLQDYLDWETHFYLNRGNTNNWLQIELAGPKGNTNAIGAKISITAGGKTQLQQAGFTDGAHHSQGHYRYYFGLGKADVVNSIVIIWPDGNRQQVNNQAVNQLLVIRYGSASL